MDREAWSAAIHGAAKSRSRLSDWTEIMQCIAIESDMDWASGEWPEKHIYQIPPIETIPKGGATAEISGKKQISIFVSTLFCITNHSKF